MDVCVTSRQRRPTCQAGMVSFRRSGNQEKKRRLVLVLILLGGSRVGSLLLLVPLLVGGGLGLVGQALLVGEGLPALTKDLADLAWEVLVSVCLMGCEGDLPNEMFAFSAITF